MVKCDLAELGLWLDSMAKKVFSNLSDSISENFKE